MPKYTPDKRFIFLLSLQNIRQYNHYRFGHTASQLANQSASALVRQSTKRHPIISHLLLSKWQLPLVSWLFIKSTACCCITLVATTHRIVVISLLSCFVFFFFAFCSIFLLFTFFHILIHIYIHTYLHKCQLRLSARKYCLLLYCLTVRLSVVSALRCQQWLQLNRSVAATVVWKCHFRNATFKRIRVQLIGRWSVLLCSVER